MPAAPLHQPLRARIALVGALMAALVAIQIGLAGVALADNPTIARRRPGRGTRAAG